MCGGERPENYKVPDIYTPDKEEVRRIQQEKLAMLQYEQVKKKITHWNILVWCHASISALQSEFLINQKP